MRVSAQNSNSRSALASQASASSSERPRYSASIRAFRRRPAPTTLVRLVLMALAAMGLVMYSSRLRLRRVHRLASMSNCGLAETPVISLRDFFT